jgi:cell division protein FtsW
MTEMVHGTLPAQAGEAVLSRWWRTVDRWTISCVLLLFGIGLLLALAASPPLASRNNLPPFYYFERQAVFGVAALAMMILVSMMSPTAIRRWAVLGFVATFLALALPFIGTDFGKGAVRWYSLGFASLQPSEFLKPCLVGRRRLVPGRGAGDQRPAGAHDVAGGDAVVVAVFCSSLQPDFGQAALVLAAWGVMYFVAGAPMS